MRVLKDILFCHVDCVDNREEGGKEHDIVVVLSQPIDEKKLHQEHYEREIELIVEGVTI